MNKLMNSYHSFLKGGCLASNKLFNFAADSERSPDPGETDFFYNNWR